MSTLESGHCASTSSAGENWTERACEVQEIHTPVRSVVCTWFQSSVRAAWAGSTKCRPARVSSSCEGMDSATEAPGPWDCIPAATAAFPTVPWAPRAPAPAGEEAGAVVLGAREGCCCCC